MGKKYDLLIKARGDDAQARASLKRLQREVANTGRRISATGRTMTAAITAPLIGLGVMGARELGAMEKATKQTDRAMNRFGGSAKISTTYVESLAAAIQEKSGFDDQAVQSGQNLLLTLGAVDVRTKEGVKVFKRASLSMTEFADTMGMDVATAGRLYAKTLAEATKGNIALPKGVKLSAIEMKNLEAAMKNANTATEKQSLVMDALGKKFRGGMDLTSADKMNVTMDKLAGAGAKLVTMLLPAFDVIVKVVDRLTSAFDRLSPSQQKIVGLVALLSAALGPVLMMVGNLVTLFAGPLTAALAGASFPVLGVVAGVAALGAAFVLAYKKSESFRNGVNNSLRSMKSVFMSVLSSLRQTLSTWFGWASTAWNRWGDNILSIVKPIMTGVLTYIGSIMRNIGSVIKIVLAVLRGDWGAAWDELKKMVKNTWNDIKKVVSSGITAVKNTLGTLKDAILDLSDKMLEAGKKIGKAIIDGIKKGIKEYGGDIANAVSNAIKPGALSGAIRDQILQAAGAGGKSGNGKSGPLNKRGGGSRIANSGGVNVMGEVFGSNPSTNSILNYFKLSGQQVYNVATGTDGKQTVSTNEPVKSFVENRVGVSKKRLAAFVEQRRKLLPLVKRIDKQLIVLSRKLKNAKTRKSAATKIEALKVRRDELLGAIEYLDGEILSLGGSIQQDLDSLVPPTTTDGSTSSIDGGLGSTTETSGVSSQLAASLSNANLNLAAANNAFSAFNGSGDIGFGGSTALGAARGVVNVVFNSTVPYTNEQSRMVANMVANGIYSTNQYANLNSGTVAIGA